MKPMVANHLASMGYCVQIEERGFHDYSIDLYGLTACRSNTVAVELKLTNWQRAIEQALVYQLCAHSVYIAVPTRTAQRVDVALIEKHGIGMLAVDPSGSCVVVVNPKPNPAFNEYYLRIFREELSA